MAQQQDKGSRVKVRKRSGRTAQDRAEVQARSQVLEGIEQFTTNLYKILSQEEGNVVFSPISVHAVLSMAYQGALGETAQQLAASLHVPDAQATAEGYSYIMNRLNSVEHVTLLMANKIFLMEGHKLLGNFKTTVTKHFLSEVQQVNFGSNAAEAANTINSWVKTQTKDKIQEVISKKDLNEWTRLVLVNAIYFKGNWKCKFNKEDTKTEPFYLNDVDKVDVQMMHIENKRFYYKNDESLDAKILQLPYTNEDLSLIIILPNKRNGIRDLEQKLATAKLSHLTSGMHRTTLVDIALPRFKIDKIVDLESALTKLGLGEIFSIDDANFRGMVDLPTGENLFIDKAVQKALIEVNEEGAEAAAAMYSLCGGYSGPPLPKPSFVADHPFVYLLSEKRTTHLFVGRYSKPNA